MENMFSCKGVCIGLIKFVRMLHFNERNCTLFWIVRNMPNSATIGARVQSISFVRWLLHLMRKATHFWIADCLCLQNVSSGPHIRLIVTSSFETTKINSSVLCFYVAEVLFNLNFKDYLCSKFKKHNKHLFHYRFFHNSTPYSWKCNLIN